MEVNRVLYGSVYQKLTWWYMGLFTRSIQAFTWECSVESMQCMVIEQKYKGILCIVVSVSVQDILWRVF